MSVRVTQIGVGGFDDNFAYLIHDLATQRGFVVDPSGNVSRILHAKEVLGIELVGILITHTHFDHIEGIDAVAPGGAVPVYVHELGVAKVNASTVYPLCDQQTVQVGETEVTVLHTPGHSEDAVCFLLEPSDLPPQLVTGDTLFVHGCGRIQPAQAETMFASLQRLKHLPPETVIYPGHDYGPTPTSTLEHECQHNPYLTAPDIETFRERRFAQ
jgi:glyoxylase-like metal-dependent hydrolase (beta-lactamase superfamily II)